MWSNKEKRLLCVCVWCIYVCALRSLEWDGQGIGLCASPQAETYQSEGRCFHSSEGLKEKVTIRLGQV